MNRLLFLQCLQHDFVKPLQPGDPLPNLLHVGYDESRRLLGEDPKQGPIAKLMGWANQVPQDTLDVVHIRDWHDRSDEAQAGHLNQFGTHCLAGSTGAKFVYDTVDGDNHHIVNSTTLNDFQNTDLAEQLKDCDTANLRIGIVGVWTEAKVLFLAYELSTRFPQASIAVCSALTASSSRSQHFLALQQLKNIVGVLLIDSIGEFIQFLGGSGKITSPLSINDRLTIVANKRDSVPIMGSDRLLLQYLFRDCQRIEINLLDGGFSGNIVAGIHSIDLHGQEQSPFVVKIGSREAMAQERVAFEHIEAVLGNNAPAIADYADYQDRAAIKYRYASMDDGKTQSFQACYLAGESAERIANYLQTVLDQQLGKLYRAFKMDHENLFTYYGFSARWANSVSEKINTLVGQQDQERQHLTLPGKKQIYNLHRFYRQDLKQCSPLVGDFPFAFIHGDLNGANIIIDKRHNVWLIDFFHTHVGHVLKDFAKLENDLLYIYTPIQSEQDLLLAYDFTDFLLSLDHPLPAEAKLPQQFINTPFERCYVTVKVIRKIASKYLQGPFLRQQWLLPQLRYAVHTLGFDEPSKWQRIWALYTASEIAKRLQME